jgi:SAM-dependent methyltransferase
VLDCGCGTGWLTYFLARRGYEVVGTDVAPAAIALAQSHPVFREGPAPLFRVADSEALPFTSEFDAVVFFDSLHHALDERAALAGALRALRPGGACIVLEPGRGHQRKSREIDAAYDLTDRDMPPSLVCRAGRSVGFARCRVVPAPQHLGKALYMKRFQGVRHLLVQAILLWQRWYCGIAILEKD